MLESGMETGVLVDGAGMARAEADAQAQLCRGTFPPHTKENKTGSECGSGEFRHLYPKDGMSHLTYL